VGKKKAVIDEKCCGMGKDFSKKKNPRGGEGEPCDICGKEAMVALKPKEKDANWVPLGGGVLSYRGGVDPGEINVEWEAGMVEIFIRLKRGKKARVR